MPAHPDGIHPVHTMELRHMFRERGGRGRRRANEGEGEGEGKREERGEEGEEVGRSETRA